jgi:hypothetical protein
MSRSACIWPSRSIVALICSEPDARGGEISALCVPQVHMHNVHMREGCVPGVTVKTLCALVPFSLA